MVVEDRQERARQLWLQSTLDIYKQGGARYIYQYEDARYILVRETEASVAPERTLDIQQYANARYIAV